MKLDHSKSSNLFASEYDPATREFRMTFRGKDGPGKTYLYCDVPKEAVDGFAKAESHGNYFHANIRSKYKGELV